MIVKRGVLRIIGRLHYGLRGWRDAWVEALDEKFLHDIDLTSTEGKELTEGHIVIVEITSYPGFHRRPQGHIVETLGASSDEPGMDINIVIHKHDLPHVFPDEVLAEAVLVEYQDGMVIITINRPGQRNAVNRAVSYGVCAAVDQLDANHVLDMNLILASVRHEFHCYE